MHTLVVRYASPLRVGLARLGIVAVVTILAPIAIAVVGTTSTAGSVGGLLLRGAGGDVERLEPRLKVPPEQLLRIDDLVRVLLGGTCLAFA